jgi:hypothetical protein
MYVGSVFHILVPLLLQLFLLSFLELLAVVVVVVDFLLLALVSSAYSFVYIHHNHNKHLFFECLQQIVHQMLFYL